MAWGGFKRRGHNISEAKSTPRLPCRYSRTTIGCRRGHVQQTVERRALTGWSVFLEIAQLRLMQGRPHTCAAAQARGSSHTSLRSCHLGLLPSLIRISFDCFRKTFRLENSLCLKSISLKLSLNYGLFIPGRILNKALVSCSTAGPEAGNPKTALRTCHPAEHELMTCRPDRGELRQRPDPDLEAGTERLRRKCRKVTILV